MVDIRRLPRANNSFEDIRKKNQIYVDHTDLIYEFAYLDGPNFLSRPRRFGKSLLISTLESLFSHGTEYFKGLKIERLWNEAEKGKTYKVIQLDFSTLSFENKNELDSEINEILFEVAEKNGVTLSDRKEHRSAGLNLKTLVESAPSEYVLLIDEYDCPLTHSLGNKELFESYRQYLQGLFGAIKGVTGDMRFIFITGVGRFAKTSVFSQMNSLRDLSLESKFAPLLGYTDDDMHQYFDEYVEKASKFCLKFIS